MKTRPQGREGGDGDSREKGRAGGEGGKRAKQFTKYASSWRERDAREGVTPMNRAARPDIRTSTSHDDEGHIKIYTLY